MRSLLRAINRRAERARPPFRDLTEDQQAIIRQVRQSWYKRGYPPTVREVGSHLGHSSPATTHRQLKQLEELGWLTSQPGRNRTLRVVD